MGYTAWQTTNPDYLDTDGLCDISVTDDDDKSSGRPVWHAKTRVLATALGVDPGAHARVNIETAHLLAEAGWEFAGDWENCPSGAFIAVRRAE